MQITTDFFPYQVAPKDIEFTRRTVARDRDDPAVVPGEDLGQASEVRDQPALWIYALHFLFRFDYYQPANRASRIVVRAFAFPRLSFFLFQELLRRDLAKDHWHVQRSANSLVKLQSKVLV